MDLCRSIDIYDLSAWGAQKSVIPLRARSIGVHVLLSKKPEPPLTLAVGVTRKQQHILEHMTPGPNVIKIFTVVSFDFT